MEYIPLAEEYSISEAGPPPHFIGRSLKDLDLRNKFQINVVAIKDVLTDEFIVVPRPDHVIKDSDVLVLIGKTEDIDKALAKK
jgi:trk system potassium uptake protein TrkA